MGKKRKSDAALLEAKRAKQEGTSSAMGEEGSAELGLQEARDVIEGGEGKGDEDARLEENPTAKATSKKTKNAEGATFRRSSRIQQIEEKAKEVHSSTNVLVSVALKKNSNEEADCTEETGEHASVKVKQVGKVVKARISKSRVSAPQQQEVQELPSSYCAAQVDDPEAAQKVKETLRLFNTYYLRSVQVSEILFTRSFSNAEFLPESVQYHELLHEKHCIPSFVVVVFA